MKLDSLVESIKSLLAIDCDKLKNLILNVKLGTKCP